MVDVNDISDMAINMSHCQTSFEPLIPLDSPSSSTPCLTSSATLNALSLNQRCRRRPLTSFGTLSLLHDIIAVSLPPFPPDLVERPHRGSRIRERTIEEVWSEDEHGDDPQEGLDEGGQ